MSKLRVTRSKAAGPDGQTWETIAFAGSFEEDLVTTIAPLKADAEARVVFNFRDVSDVNSLGVRDWILFMRDFQKTREVVFEECSPAVVTQMNMIPGFFGQAKVLSVFAPFTCDDCRANSIVKFEPPYPASNADVVTDKCSKCMGDLALADTVVEYFDFANG